MKKIIAVNGSPRPHGSTAVLLDGIIKGAGQDTEVETYNLNVMNIKSCQSCYACKKDGRCILQDDMQPLYRAIAAADGIVLGTPVYMWQMSAQLKQMVDRLYPFLKLDHSSYLVPGKKVLLAATQARADTEMFRHYFEHTGNFLGFMGFGEYKIIIAGGTRKPEDVHSQPAVLAEAGRLGAWLASAAD